MSFSQDISGVERGLCLGVTVTLPNYPAADVGRWEMRHEVVQDLFRAYTIVSWVFGLKLSHSEPAVKYDLPLIQILSVSVTWYPQRLWLANSHKLRSLPGCIIILKRPSISVRSSFRWNEGWHACQSCKRVHRTRVYVLYDHFWFSRGAWLARPCSVSGYLYTLKLGMFRVAVWGEQLPILLRLSFKWYLTKTLTVTKGTLWMC